MKVAVEATVVLVLAMGVSVPTAPLAVAHAAEAEGVGFGVVVVGFGVVVKEQSNVADTSVAPVTVAVMVCVWVGTVTENWPVTETTTWLAAPLLPHPLTQRPANASANKVFLAFLCHFIPAVSPHI